MKTTEEQRAELRRLNNNVRGKWRVAVVARNALPALLDDIATLSHALTEQTAAWEKAEADARRLGGELLDAESAVAATRDGIGELLADNGCECECGHHPEDHNEECEHCFPCRVQAVLSRYRDAGRALLTERDRLREENAVLKAER